MRFIFKTSYDQDIGLAKHGGHRFWYSVLLVVLVVALWTLPDYWLAQLTFVLIYGIVGLGLMLLAGFTGLFSLGHAAFLGVGAYTETVLASMGWPFPLSLAVAAGLSAAVGAVVGIPALRVKGIYLGIATLAFGFIVEEILARWESVTGGNSGKIVPSVDVFGDKPFRLEEYWNQALFDRFNAAYARTYGAMSAFLSENKVDHRMVRPAAATAPSAPPAPEPERKVA